MKDAAHSAGLLMFRRGSEEIEVFLVHPGGPFFKNKDLGSWTIPKGVFTSDEDPLTAAAREFAEETGQAPEACALGSHAFIPLGTIKQRGGKTVHAWGFEGDWSDAIAPHSNTFAMEFPPRSGALREFPEVDAWSFFPVTRAVQKINPAQIPLIERLLTHLASTAP